MLIMLGRRQPRNRGVEGDSGVKIMVRPEAVLGYTSSSRTRFACALIVFTLLAESIDLCSSH